MEKGTSVAASSPKSPDNRGFTFRDRQCRAPLIPQDIETNRSIRVDVRMVDLGREGDFGRFEGVVGRERDRQEEDASSVRRVCL